MFHHAFNPLTREIKLLPLSWVLWGCTLHSALHSELRPHLVFRPRYSLTLTISTSLLLVSCQELSQSVVCQVATFYLGKQ